MLATVENRPFQTEFLRPSLVHCSFKEKCSAVVLTDEFALVFSLSILKNLGRHVNI